MNIIILGPPGSGKGTQAKIMSHFFSLVVVDTGKLLRSAVASQKDLLNDINLGNLLSDDFVIRVVEGHLLTFNGDFILDGFPRTQLQAKSFMDFASVHSRPVNCVVKMSVDDDTIIKRLSTRFVCNMCGAIFSHELEHCSECNSDNIQKRADDSNLGAVMHRIYQYKRELPLLCDVFFDFGIRVVDVDASQSVEQVTKDIQKGLL